MKIQEMTRKDFDAVPYRSSWNSVEKPFNSIVLLPLKRYHDSGYRCIDFVSVDDNDEPIARLSGCSDVLHINGIGGYGDWRNTVPKARPIEGWSIDCLPKSGLIRLFCNSEIICGHALSSFEIFWKERSK